MNAPGRFETDVFLCFADADDASVLPGEPGWITGFRTALGAFAQQILGRPLAIRASGEPDVAGGIGPIGSATFVAVLSPAFLQDPERTAQLTTFSEAAGIAADQTGDRSKRIFKVVKTPVSPETVPDAIRRNLEYAFFDLDETTGAAREFRSEFGPEAKQRFLSKTYELAQELCARVRSLQTGEEQAPTPTSPQRPEAEDQAPGHEVGEPSARNGATAAPVPGSVTADGNGGPAPSGPAVARAERTPSGSTGAGRTVYLAQTTSDLQATRDLVRGELLQLGHTVLPDRELPLDAARLRSVVEEAVARSDLAVHLVGNHYGIIPEGGSKSIIELQCELTEEAARSPRIIWIPADSVPADDRQAEFRSTLEIESVARRKTDLLRTPVEELKTAIQDTLQELEKAERTPVTADDQIYIYLICDEKDLRATKPLEDFLSSTGFQVWRPTFGGDASEIRELHRQYMLDCDANIVFYGEASDTWLQMKLVDWRKVVGWGRSAQMLAKAVYVSAPLTDHKRRLRTPEALLIESADSFSQERLKPFLDEIQRRKSEN